MVAGEKAGVEHADGHHALAEFLGGGELGGGRAWILDYPAGLNPFEVVAADVDVDGRPDLAVVNYDGNNVAVLRNVCLP